MMPLPEKWRPPFVLVAGIGMGRGLTGTSPEFHRFLSQAELIFCPESLLPELDSITDVEKMVIKSPLADVIEKIRKESEAKKVMVIASGDPLFYGIGRQLGEALGRNRLVVIPNLTSVQYLFSRLALPWDDVICFSLHSEDRRDFFYWLRNSRKIAILTGPSFSPSFIARLLEKHSMGETVKMIVGEKLGSSEERISMVIPKEAVEIDWKTPNVVALLPEGHTEMIGGFFKEEDFSHDRGMITKLEVRALVVSALRLNPGEILWDLGAGSGSVSIEACYRVPLRAVYAVEKNPGRYDQLVANIKSFRCGEIISHLGDALELVSRLPRPDKVFIGGGGKDIGSIIRIIYERFGKNEMPLTVISAVLWSSIQEVLRIAETLGLSTSINYVQISRSVPLHGSFRMEPIAPVFLIRLEHPASKL